MHEQRLTVRMLKYWDMIRKNKKYPEIQRLNSAAIEDLWPQCFQVSLTHQKKAGYKYEYMGPLVAEIYGRDLTGMHVDENMRQFPGAVLIKKLGEVVSDHVPVEDDGYFVNDHGKLIKYRACFLPFGSEITGLTHIVVGLSFRVF